MIGGIVEIVLVLALSARFAEGQSCSDGWRSHDESCYVFMRETYTWFDAKVTCEALDAKLVEIETAEENHYLAGLIHSYGASQSWIGLQDFIEEGEFVWTSSQEGPEEFHWAPNEPDDRYEGEDCAAMTTAGLWFDGHCEDTHRPFICEKPFGEEEIIG